MSATATAVRRRRSAVPSCCADCGDTLAEGLLGQLRCLRRRCTSYRTVVATNPKARPSKALVAALTPEPAT